METEVPPPVADDFRTRNPASAQSAKSSRDPSPASVTARLIILAPSGIGTSNRQAGDWTRITGLAAASLPSMNTLKTTLGYLARLEPLLAPIRFSSAPARPTN